MIPTVASRIVKGSNGIWGSQLMAAHPQISQSEAELMTKYILSLSDGASMGGGLPTNGSYTFDKHKTGDDGGEYILKCRQQLYAITPTITIYLMVQYRGNNISTVYMLYKFI